MSENADHDLCPAHTGKGFISCKPDYRKFQAMLNEYCPAKPVTETEAEDAYRNLGEFVSLLVRINERVGAVKMGDWPDPSEPLERT